MLLVFLHISLCVSLKVKAGPQHERKNYSTLPLIDSVGDYANSYTSMLLYHWDSGCDRHEMSPLGQTKPKRQSQRGREWWYAAHVSRYGKDCAQAMLWCSYCTEQAALMAFLSVSTEPVTTTLVCFTAQTSDKNKRRWDSHKETQGSDQQCNKKVQKYFLLIFSQHFSYLIWPWQTKAREVATENTVMLTNVGTAWNHRTSLSPTLTTMGTLGKMEQYCL